MKKIIILIGISGSGKSTYSNQFIKNNQFFIKNNRDDLRKSIIGDLDGYYEREDLKTLENIVSKFQEASYFIENYNIIDDNTNCNLHLLKKKLKLLDDNRYLFKISFKFFDCDLKIAQNRVYRRDFLSIDEDNFDDHYEFIDFSNNIKVEYIEKQYEEYLKTKEYILKYYPNNIIE